MKVQLVRGSAIHINPRKKYFILLSSAEQWTTADMASANRQLHERFPNMRFKLESCKNCGKKISYNKHNPIRFFCNHKCYTAWHQAEKHQNWVGDAAGYAAI